MKQSSSSETEKMLPESYWASTLTVRVEKSPLQQMLCEKQELITATQTQPCLSGSSTLAVTYLLTVASQQRAPVPFFSRNCHFVFRQSLQRTNIHTDVFSLRGKVCAPTAGLDSHPLG